MMCFQIGIGGYFLKNGFFLIFHMQSVTEKIGTSQTEGARKKSEKVLIHLTRYVMLSSAGMLISVVSMLACEPPAAKTDSLCVAARSPLTMTLAVDVAPARRFHNSGPIIVESPSGVVAVMLIGMNASLFTGMRVYMLRAHMCLCAAVSSHTYTPAP